MHIRVLDETVMITPAASVLEFAKAVEHICALRAFATRRVIEATQRGEEVSFYGAGPNYSGSLFTETTINLNFLEVQVLGSKDVVRMLLNWLATTENGGKKVQIIDRTAHRFTATLLSVPADVLSSYNASRH
ncbi:MAG TPA: hypothetical protein VLA88_00230 [Candidatus Saccharimonadales bacterium]|nr:hypothetical protein [Candidatus Saccharimonadales bacterium]